jgi:tungstate transport system substrate-binding protein
MTTYLRTATLWICALALCAGCGAQSGERTLLLVTTTSVRDSGLLAALLPVFEERTGVRAKVVAVGSGAALRMGRDGSAEVLLTHAPEGEAELVASGAATSRTPFMENYFVIAGPGVDPARVREASSPAEAFKRIANAPARFLSRSDDSGTHRREVSLMLEAGIDPEAGWPGLARSGAGMGQTLQIAGERHAYVLSDLGTFLAFQEHIGLEVLSKPAPGLRNVYSVVLLNPEKLKPGRMESAALFKEFLIDPQVQILISEFGRERFGRSLFRPLHL